MGKSLLLSLLLVAAATSCASEPPTTPLAPTEAVRYTKYLKRKYFYLGFIAGGLTVWMAVIALALIAS